MGVGSSALRGVGNSAHNSKVSSSVSPAPSEPTVFEDFGEEVDEAVAPKVLPDVKAPTAEEGGESRPSVIYLFAYTNSSIHLNYKPPPLPPPPQLPRLATATATATATASTTTHSFRCTVLLYY